VDIQRLTPRVEELGEKKNLLAPVFRDGVLLRDYGFDEVKTNLFYAKIK